MNTEINNCAKTLANHLEKNTGDAVMVKE